jgi:hypothetical protein
MMNLNIRNWNLKMLKIFDINNFRSKNENLSQILMVPSI